MRAAVVDQYGGPEVVRVAEVDDPVAGRGQVLVRVNSVAVTIGDARIRGARFPDGFGILARLALGITRPRRPILGSAHAGVVAAIGADVTGISLGDRVCAMTGSKMGAHAELVRLPAERAVPIPDTVSDDDAAALLFGGVTALHFLDRTKVRAGSQVLITGASGAVGSAAVQLAALRGAAVTAITSTPHLGTVTELGAGRVIDRSTTPLDQTTDRYDAVIDAAGSLSIATGRRLLVPEGRLALVVASLGDTIRARGAVVAGPSPESAEAMASLLAMVAAGDLKVLIDPDHDPALGLTGVAEAHRRIDAGIKRGTLLVHPAADA